MAPEESVRWTCHICGEERPDDKISVLSKPVILHGRVVPGGVQNIRFCNDKPACIEGAKDKVLIGDKREFEIREIRLGDHPFLKSLTEWPRTYAGSDPETVITVVAVAGNHDDWAAYYQPPWCPAAQVYKFGNKLPEEAAAEIFPEWAKRLAWRR